jgi:hypothetical protein
VSSFKNAHSKRPNSLAVSGHDGMHLIFEALKKTGDAMIAAMKGKRWESPRGPIEIDPRTRDVVQRVHPQGRAGEWAAVECRIGDLPDGQRSRQRGEEMNSPRLRIAIIGGLTRSTITRSR